MIKEIPYIPKYQAYVIEDEDGRCTYSFISRYYAYKWIRENVPEIDQKMWKVFEVNGSYRVFRFTEYEF